MKKTIYYHKYYFTKKDFIENFNITPSASTEKSESFAEIIKKESKDSCI